MFLSKDGGMTSLLKSDDSHQFKMAESIKKSKFLTMTDEDHIGKEKEDRFRKAVNKKTMHDTFWTDFNDQIKEKSNNLNRTMDQSFGGPSDFGKKEKKQNNTIKNLGNISINKRKQSYVANANNNDESLEERSKITIVEKEL